MAGDALQDGDFWALVPCARTFPCDATAARCHLASSYYNIFFGGKIVGGAFHQKAPFGTEFSAGVTVGTDDVSTPVGEYVLCTSKAGTSGDGAANTQCRLPAAASPSDGTVTQESWKIEPERACETA